MWPPRHGPQVGVETAAFGVEEDVEQAFVHACAVDLLRRGDDDEAHARRATLRPLRTLGRDAHVLDAAVRARADDDLVDP